MLTEGIIVLILAAIGYDKARKEKNQGGKDYELVTQTHLINIIIGSLMIFIGSNIIKLSKDTQHQAILVAGAFVLIASAMGYSKAKKEGITGKAKDLHIGNIVMGAYLIVGFFALGYVENSYGSVEDYYNTKRRY
jgi:hypothetical protein